MSTQTQRLLTSNSVKSIMAKRDLVHDTKIGKKVILTIQGDGNIVDVLDKEKNPVTSTIPGYEGTVLQKRIFNLKANSSIAMQNQRTRQLFIDGCVAEKQGDVEGASELFNEYLNRCQLSFGVLLPSAVVDQLGNGVDVAAKVIGVTTENGSLLTIDPSTISVQAPEVLEAGTSFDMSDFVIPEAEPLSKAELEKRQKARAKA